MPQDQEVFEESMILRIVEIRDTHDLRGSVLERSGEVKIDGESVGDPLRGDDLRTIEERFKRNGWEVKISDKTPG